MDLKRMDELLRRYADNLPARRLFSKPVAERLRERLADEPEAVRGEVCFGGRKRLATIAVAATAVAAVLITIAVNLPQRPAPATAIPIQADGRFTRAELFSSTRGAVRESGDQLFYLGVKLEQSAFLCVITRDNRGRLELLKLNTADETTLRLPAGQAQSFGAYAIRAEYASGGVSELTHFVVVATPERVDAHTVEDIANRIAAGSSADMLERLTADLKERLGASVRIITVPPAGP
jgi:hypothetical protein